MHVKKNRGIIISDDQMLSGNAMVQNNGRHMSTNGWQCGDLKPVPMTSCLPGQ
jgi:hypothetical protein